MILLERIAAVINNNQDLEQLFVRNLLKEELQNYILNFVYTNQNYNQLIFTGGTCLRKVYGLNRLSEDLDFDIDAKSGQEPDLAQFASDVTAYFKKSVNYANLRFSLSGNENTVYFKFPLLKDLEFYADRTPEDIFVRCDFSLETTGAYRLDQNLITAGDFQFFVKSYDLATLFANKIVAFLQRSFFKGKMQKIPFKGRDVYDLYWLTQLSSKSSFELQANQKRIQALLPNKTIEEIKLEIKEKLQQLDDKFLYRDLRPVLASGQVLQGFIDSYQQYLTKYIDFVL